MQKLWASGGEICIILQDNSDVASWPFANGQCYPCWNVNHLINYNWYFEMISFKFNPFLQFEIIKKIGGFLSLTRETFWPKNCVTGMNERPSSMRFLMSRLAVSCARMDAITGRACWAAQFFFNKNIGCAAVKYENSLEASTGHYVKFKGKKVAFEEPLWFYKPQLVRMTSACRWFHLSRNEMSDKSEGCSAPRVTPWATDSQMQIW